MRYSPAMVYLRAWSDGGGTLFGDHDHYHYHAFVHAPLSLAGLHPASASSVLSDAGPGGAGIVPSAATKRARVSLAGAHERAAERVAIHAQKQRRMEKQRAKAMPPQPIAGKAHTHTHSPIHKRGTFQSQ